MSNQEQTFKKIRSQHVDTLNLNVEEYEHQVTGAKHYHLSADNSENVFLVALRTVPTDSTGVAHILEHTVLCGSERYPVRDPFFMMIRRSLNTFMNAFTSSDWTAYPFASKNRKDFFNLMDVYLDAVFFSNLNQLDFAQEGHRLEFAEPENANSNLVYKGVVYNEMKGAMSSPISTLWQTLTKHLFPTSTYHFNSGGEPAEIPSLDYAGLQDFYRTHYHPSNAVFMTYGDIPAAEHQQRIEELALRRFERSAAHIKVENEQRYSAPLALEERYAIDDKEEEKDRSHIVMGWLLGNATNLREALNAELLAGVLLDDSSAPLRHALETTDLGNAPSPICGLENSHKEMTFICGLEGSNPEQAEATEKLILETLQKVADDGIEQSRIEAALHQLELAQREVGGGHYPYGLQLILDALPSAIHYSDPVSALNLDPVLEQLREDIKDRQFIPNLIHSLLLDNPHRVRLCLKPSTTLSTEQQAEEAARLAKIKARLSDEEKSAIIAQSKALLERQNQEDDESILPKVSLSDVPDAMDIAKENEKDANGATISRFEQGTNGIIYQQVITKLPNLEDELLDVLPYYTQCLTELGYGDKDYLTAQAWQSQVSGGIGAYTSFRSKVKDVQDANGYLILSGKALAHNHQAFSQLLQETFHTVRFDEHHRIREIIAQIRASRERGITDRGHTLAMRAASSGMSPAAAIRHRLSGITGIQHIKQLDDGLDNSESIQQLAETFVRIHERITASPREFLIIGEQNSLDELSQDIAGLWKNEPAAGFHDIRLPSNHGASRTLWTTSTAVNFCAKSYATVPNSHPDSAALAVLGGFLRNGYLHRAIREQGGAYGAGASHDSDNACFTFYSYRDPRLAETLNDFNRALEWMLSSDHDWTKVEEAILGLISQIDKPSSPAGEAKDAYHNQLNGRTPELRQAYRKRILEVGLKDLQRVTEKYLLNHSCSIAVITNSQQSGLADSLGLEVNAI